ncbi:MAG: metallophosphoesterase family protein, partial [Saprospiraceae bacterium]|nr:metallophosphoesterase family protein [Saprospiraceae bacterium]
MMRLVFFASVLAVLLASGCRTELVNPHEDDPRVYPVLGHIYQWHTPHEDNRIDFRLESYDFQQHAGLILAGDLCSEASKYAHTIDYLDGLFELEEEPVLWAVGNHDVRNGNTHFIEAATNRPLFYTSSHHGLVWLLLCTSFDDIPDITDP